MRFALLQQILFGYLSYYFLLCFVGLTALGFGIKNRNQISEFCFFGHLRGFFSLRDERKIVYLMNKDWGLQDLLVRL